MIALLLVFVCLPLLFACDRGASTAPKEPSDASAGEISCFRHAEAEEAEVDLEGDVDGDGSRERVSVLVDRSGAPDCGALLLVEGERDYTARVEVIDESVFALGFPAPRTLVEIDGAPGLEIVVNVHAGASTEFAAVYTVSGGRLVRMGIEGAAQDLLAFGGSVTHLENADCADDGRLVVASATSQGRRYVVTRSFLRPRATSLEVERRERTTIAQRRLTSIPELAAPAFASCG